MVSDGALRASSTRAARAMCEVTTCIILLGLAPGGTAEVPGLLPEPRARNPARRDVSGSRYSAIHDRRHTMHVPPWN